MEMGLETIQMDPMPISALPLQVHPHSMELVAQIQITTVSRTPLMIVQPPTIYLILTGLDVGTLTRMDGPRT